LLTGSATAADYKGIRLVKIYAPYVMSRRTERGQLYNTELPFLLHADHENMIPGGDFNCALDPVDTTGNFQNSRALANLIHGTHLTDTWIQNSKRPIYTHHPLSGAARLDCIYVSQGLMEKLAYKSCL